MGTFFNYVSNIIFRTITCISLCYIHQAKMWFVFRSTAEGVLFMGFEFLWFKCFLSNHEFKLLCKCQIFIVNLDALKKFLKSKFYKLANFDKPKKLIPPSPTKKKKERRN